MPCNNYTATFALHIALQIALHKVFRENDNVKPKVFSSLLLLLMSCCVRVGLGYIIRRRWVSDCFIDLSRTDWYRKTHHIVELYVKLSIVYVNGIVIVEQSEWLVYWFITHWLIQKNIYHILWISVVTLVILELFFCGSVNTFKC